MMVSRYETKLTRDQRQGHKSPSRDMTNRKAEEQPIRKREWVRRQCADETSSRAT